MALPVAGWAVSRGVGILASFALFEGVMALFENMGDASPGNEPEAIQQALMRLQHEGSQGALWNLNKGAIEEDMRSEQFSGISPQSELPMMALLGQGVVDRTNPQKYPVMSHLHQKMGLDPDQFIRRTSPTRMGDLSTLQNSIPIGMREKQTHGQPS